MEKKTCCFTGHRYIQKEKKKEVEKAVAKEVEQCIQKGITCFCIGGALGFDTLCAKVVLEAKEDNPWVELVLILPCREQTKGWHKKDILVYETIKARADKVVYIVEEYEKGCMLRRNRRLVDTSDYCIAYLKQKRGGTYYTVCYALKEGVAVCNIAVEYPTCR